MPSLERVPDVAFAREIIAAYEPQATGLADQQKVLRAAFLAFVDAHPSDAHERSCVPGHLTASVLLVGEGMEGVLLHHHKKLDLWLQFGGHCDGDANLYACARRELIEESGLAPSWLSERPIDLDAHIIPASGSEPEHVHWDVRYLATVPRDAQPVCSDESHELRWFEPKDVWPLVDHSVGRLIDLAWDAIP